MILFESDAKIKIDNTIFVIFADKKSVNKIDTQIDWIEQKIIEINKRLNKK